MKFNSRIIQICFHWISSKIPTTTKKKLLVQNRIYQEFVTGLNFN